MTYFNFSSDNQDIDKELELRQAMLDELRLMGYWKKAQELIQIMKKNSVNSFGVREIETNFENGCYATIKNIKVKKTTKLVY